MNLYLSALHFLPIYLIFLIAGLIERVSSTFKSNKKKSIYKMSKYWFLVPFLTYVGLILISILEFFITFKNINFVISLAGFFIFFSGVSLRRSAIASLGDNWSIYSEVREGQAIQTEQIYKKLKHPYYLAVMLELVGASLIANAFFSAVLVFVVQGPLLLVRIYLEEKMLKTYFPDVYGQYVKGKLF